MAYEKAGIREVEFPRNREEMNAIGYDTDSLRSMGAAYYRMFAEISAEAAGMMVRAMPQIFDRVVVEAAKEGDLIYLSSEREAIIYMVEGTQIAATEAGDAETEKYASEAIEALKQSGE